MSGARGNIRKIYDQPPAAITSNGNYDGSGSPTTAWTTGIATLWLSSISQSTADNGRVGISVAAESLDFRLKITPSNSVSGYQHLRMIVVADNECDGTQPALNEILGATSGSVSPATIDGGAHLAFLQPAYFGRFHVIEDKNWVMYNSSTANSFTESLVPHAFYHEAHHDLKGHRIMWDTTDASTISNARKGHIFVYFLYSNQVCNTGGIPVQTTANPPVIQYSVRIRFRDA